MTADHHLAMLAASGITDEFAMARGYETITDPKRLAELGIVKAARNCVPGLLVPMLRVDGSTWGYQYRPDVPRLRNGWPAKYETPWRQRNGLDIPPGVADRLGDPTVPLWITEGSQKSRLRRNQRAVHRRPVRCLELAAHQQCRRQNGASRVA